jgi:glucan-binding YG repeat protein
MKKFIRNLLIVAVTLLMISGQSVLAVENDLNTSVYNHLENWDAEFEISYYNSDVLDVIKDIAKKDDYLTISLRRLVYERSGKSATIKVTYLTTKEQEEYINTELTTIVNSIITNNMSDFDKITTINTYIINRYQYDYSLTSNNAYTALTTGKATCQGYAMTVYKMLNLAGVENKIIVGYLDGVAHGWNLVKLNGKWYHLDVTDNDVANNKYFLKNDKALRNDGFTWEAKEYPICDKDYEIEPNNSGQPSIGYKSKVDGDWYFSNNSWYFRKKIGIYALGWNRIDNNWYCLGSTGTMQTGWIHYSEKWYYCYPQSGAMAVNTIIDGYIVDSNGAWVV